MVLGERWNYLRDRLWGQAHLDSVSALQFSPVGSWVIFLTLVKSQFLQM